MAKFATLAGLTYFYQRVKSIFEEKFATKDVATAEFNGLMSAEDKTKLNGVASGATANTGTVTSVGAGLGLDGGDITTSGTIKVKLSDETPYQGEVLNLSNAENRLYPVGVDQNGCLAVNVPWQDMDTQYGTMTPATVTTAGGSGLVPAPGVGENEAFLRGDGSWQELGVLTNAEIDSIFEEDNGNPTDPNSTGSGEEGSGSGESGTGGSGEEGSGSEEPGTGESNNEGNDGDEPTGSGE